MHATLLTACAPFHSTACSAPVFEALYLLVTYGHDDAAAEKLDPPDDYFRIRCGGGVGHQVFLLIPLGALGPHGAVAGGCKLGSDE